MQEQSTRVKTEEIACTAGDPITVLRFSGDITSASQAAVLGTYQGLGDKAKRILLDFSKVEYLNSSGIALVIQMMIAAGKQGQVIHTFGLTPHFQKVFTMVGITKYTSCTRMRRAPARRSTKPFFGILDDRLKTATPRLAGRNHQFDLLRILFAICVLLSHAPEITDGNPSRELFNRFTHGHLTFGAFGVYGFFLLSGFLIVQSWQHDPELVNYLRKRILRIVPGYLVAALSATVAVGLLAPGIDHFFRHLDNHFVKSILLLSSPSTPPVLPGLPYPLVDGSLWTIPYEFRCYVLVALCGLFGLLRRPLLWLGFTLLMGVSLCIPATMQTLHWAKPLWPIVGDPAVTFTMTAVFCVGASFYLFRNFIVFRPLFAAVAVSLFLAVNQLHPALDELALVLCGGYLLFYLGRLHLQWLSWMRRVPDISYGIYLYGWPVEALWVFFRHGSPWVTFFACTLISMVLGWLSWHLVERPMLKLKRRATAPLPAA